MVTSRVAPVTHWWWWSWKQWRCTPHYHPNESWIEYAMSTTRSEGCTTIWSHGQLHHVRGFYQYGYNVLLSCGQKHDMVLYGECAAPVTNHHSWPLEQVICVDKWVVGSAVVGCIRCGIFGNLLLSTTVAASKSFTLTNELWAPLWLSP